MPEYCKICAAVSNPFAKVTVLRKYAVSYYRCGSCGFVQTDEPFWLAEAYTEAINRSDVGLVSRNFSKAGIVRAVIPTFFDPTARFIDYAGGYGLFVRLMRDVGFDFYRYDKYCANLFAPDFDVDQNNRFNYELLTAFEVFEHLANPLEEMERMLAFSKNIFFSTELLPTSTPRPDEWSYYGPEHGQHLAFYTEKTLRTIAEKFSLYFYTNGTSLHLFSERKISVVVFKLICRHRVASLVNHFYRRQSLLATDYQKITGRKLS